MNEVYWGSPGSGVALRFSGGGKTPGKTLNSSHGLVVVLNQPTQVDGFYPEGNMIFSRVSPGPSPKSEDRRSDQLWPPGVLINQMERPGRLPGFILRLLLMRICIYHAPG